MILTSFGSHFITLGFLLARMCNVCFSLVFECLFCWEVLLSRVPFLFAGTVQENITRMSLVDREGRVEDFDGQVSSGVHGVDSRR